MADDNRFVRVTGTGCAVVDVFYTPVSFADLARRGYMSAAPRDGGLIPGGLVFRDDFEAYAGVDLDAALEQAVGTDRLAGFNVGGPSLVAMVCAAQLLSRRRGHVSFYGARGDDEAGRRIQAILDRTPLDTHGYALKQGPTPTTCVFSDPDYHDGHGERSFVNTIGAAGQFGLADLDEAFFAADVQAFGGTALVPPLHAGLADLLRLSRQHGGVNVVHTVYDFLSEKRSPGAHWPLGGGEATYPLMDLLVMDAEEALRISGAPDVRAACEHFVGGGVHALVVTQGAEPVVLCSDGSPFAPLPLSSMPVSARVVAERRNQESRAQGDTTGCGDNFVGAVIACTAAFVADDAAPGEWSLPQAVALGICAGGCACFHLGGLCPESRPAEKADTVAAYYEDYRHQVRDVWPLPDWPL